ncbi:MAG TPA: hypothetical protein VF763_13165 [Candidatus Limnocylindrales bacterium]
MEARDPAPRPARPPARGAGGSGPVREAVRPAPVPPPARRPDGRPHLSVYQQAPDRSGRPAALGPQGGARPGFGLPNLRRNVCPHFYMTGTRGAIPIQAPHLLKALIRQEQNISRCQLRGGVHLEQGYVSDVCLSPRFNQCVFYEDELTKG